MGERADPRFKPGEVHDTGQRSVSLTADWYNMRVARRVALDGGPGRGKAVREPAPIARGSGKAPRMEPYLTRAGVARIGETVESKIESRAVPPARVHFLQMPWARRARHRLACGVRRLWTLLPPEWMRSAYLLISRIAARLPEPLATRLQWFFGRLWAESAVMEQEYSAWIELFEPIDAAARRTAEAVVAGLADPPLISVLMPVYNPVPEHLLAAIESVRDQFYTRWELCIAERRLDRPGDRAAAA